MTKLFDLESGNWENSEVARNLIEILEAQASVEQADSAGVDSSTINAEPTSTVEASPDFDAEALNAEFDNWRVRHALVRLASDAACSGNIRAAHLIERMLVDLD